MQYCKKKDGLLFNENSKIIANLCCGNLELPSNLTSIATNAFASCAGLTGTLTIPASVTSIGRESFADCTGLTGLDLSKAKNLQTIDISAFEGCLNLSGNIIIPINVNSIGEYAFYQCHFTSINVETGNAKYSMATNLGSNCYVVLDGTTNGIFDSNSKVIGSLAFGELVLPNTLTFIGSYAFLACAGLTGTLSIPDSVRSIQNSAFFECTGLTSLDLSNATRLEVIYSWAFENCNNLIGSLSVPKQVVWIQHNAFNGTKINNVVFSSNLFLHNEYNIFGVDNKNIIINVPQTIYGEWINIANIKTILGIADINQIHSYN